ncbi:MAG: ECF transporter S component [Oscillospiraceae bacterium]|nr:ECF transporter S component [Oscillospiraceae bacterium]
MDFNFKLKEPRKSNWNKKKTQTVVGMGMLTALVAVLQVFASGIRLGPFSITLTLVPIIIGAALYGWKAGALLGFVFGAIVMFTPDVAAFMAISVPATLVTVLLKGTLAGLCAGLLYSLIEKKNRTAAVIVSGIAAPIVNTGVFLLGCFMFFMEIVHGLAAAWAAEKGIAENVLLYVIVGMVGWNFLVELAINLMLSSAIVFIIKLVKGRIKAI